jgi:hypothetical protein
VALLKLPKLPTAFKIINRDGTPTNVFQKWWQSIASGIEVSVNAIALALEAAGIALDAAAAAQAAADQASNVADAQAAETSLVNSYVTGFTPPLIEADEFGGVTIANHQRVYGDSTLNPTVAVTGASIPTIAIPGQVVRVYYDDPTRAGGPVTYQYTIDPAAPPVQTGNRHSVAAVTIPATGTEIGKFVRPPGYVDVTTA